MALAVRSGFPVTATHAGAAAGYTVTTAAFSANAGDELCAIAVCGGLPEVNSRNSADTGAGTLKWVRRFVTRADHQNSALNRAGAFQLAIYTAVVPSGGVTERATFTTPFAANDGAQPTFPDNLPAQLVVIAVDDTNGVGAIAWRGSVATGTGGSNDITTGAAATHPIKPFGTSSLIIGGGWFINGSTPSAASGCTEIVAPGTNGMPVWTKTGGSAGTDVLVGSSVTDSTMWALGLIEYLPLTTPKPTKKLFCFGDSGIESNLAAKQTAVVVQDALAPDWEVFNQGVWWSHTAQVLSRWTADNADFPTIDAAIIQVGINDIADNGGGTTWPSASQTDLTSLYAALDGLGIPFATYTGIGPLATPGVAPAGYYDMRDWITANVPVGTHLYSLDLVTDPGAGYLAVYSAYQAADGNHIDAAGNAITGADIATWIGTLAAPPVITAQPTDQTVNDGATATFSLTATDADTYQWQDNSSGSFADISGATSSSYSPAAAAYSMQGRQYRCVATNTTGSTTSDAAALRVAFNLSGTGPRAVPLLGGGPFGAGAFGETYTRGPASGGSGATVNGQTLTVTASIIAGAAQASSSIAGQVLTSTASILAGAATAAATVAGQTLTVTASIIAGAASAAASVAGQVLTVNASTIDGAASGGGNATVNGQTLTVTASTIDGAASAAASVAGQLLTSTASIIAGAASAGSSVAGQTLTSSASIIAGAAQADSSTAGQLLTSVASILAGAASGTGSATVNGQTLTVTVSTIDGATAADSSVSGQTLTVNASILAGVAFGPSAGGVAPAKNFRIGIGIGL